MGGAQARFCAVANHHGRALRHAIVAMDGRTDCRERLDGSLDATFPVVAVRRGDWIGNLRRFLAVLREQRPDVLLTHNFGSIEWALAALLPGHRVRHVHVEDGFGPEERDRQLPRRIRLRRLALRRATVVLPSRVLLQIARTVWRLDEHRLRYVPNGVDLARFTGDVATPPPWFPTGCGPIVGTVAGLRAEKNIARLLHALATSPGMRLMVIGDGPERPALTALAESLGIAARTAFVGHVADPADAYRHMDIFALSSDTEQMPLSVLEAMAAGLPIAATDVGDVRDMVSAENRPYLTERSDTALAATLTRLAADAGLRRSVGAANRVRAAETYDQAQMFAAWGRLIGSGAAPRAARASEFLTDSQAPFANS